MCIGRKLTTEDIGKFFRDENGEKVRLTSFMVQLISDDGQTHAFFRGTTDDYRAHYSEYGECESADYGSTLISEWVES